VYVGAGAGAGAGVKTRVRGGAAISTCWGYRRRCRVAPALSGFWYPGDKAKAVTRSRGDEGGAQPAAGADSVLGGWTVVDDSGHPRVIVLAHRLRPNGIA